MPAMKEIDVPPESSFGTLEVEDLRFLENLDNFLLLRNPESIPEFLGSDPVKGEDLMGRFPLEADKRAQLSANDSSLHPGQSCTDAVRCR